MVRQSRGADGDRRLHVRGSGPCGRPGGRHRYARRRSIRRRRCANRCGRPSGPCPARSARCSSATFPRSSPTSSSPPSRPPRSVVFASMYSRRSALSALAQNLDPATVAKTQAFLASDLGKRMVADDVASATMGQDNIDKVMNGEHHGALDAEARCGGREDREGDAFDRVDRGCLPEHGSGRGGRYGHRVRPGSNQHRRARQEIRRRRARGARGQHARAHAPLSSVFLPGHERCGSQAPAVVPRSRRPGSAT